MASQGWTRAREAFRSASHGLALRAMPVLLSSLMLVETACNTQNQGAVKMGDSEPNAEKITKNQPEKKGTVFLPTGDEKAKKKTPNEIVLKDVDEARKMRDSLKAAGDTTSPVYETLVNRIKMAEAGLPFINKITLKFNSAQLDTLLKRSQELEKKDVGMSTKNKIVR